jgi:hypothetical protein
MSCKHYFPETAVNTLVPRALKALVAANPLVEVAAVMSLAGRATWAMACSPRLHVVTYSQARA